MALSISVRLRTGRYDAATTEPGTPEWPPHPARLFCALVASGHSDADGEALRWLERQGPPEVWASSEFTRLRAEGYVVLNARAEKDKGTAWPGRSNGVRRRVGVLPADDTFAVVWPDAEPDDQVLGRLTRLASMVPYVGRSTSWAEVTVIPALIEARTTWVRYRMVPLGAVGSESLRVPFPGYLDLLRQAYAIGHRTWQIACRTVAYAPAGSEPSEEAEPFEGPYSDLLVWSFAGPLAAIGGDDVLSVTSALRKAVMSRVADPLPPAVSGHGAEGRPHVAYLGLPNVGHARADGHLLGVGVAVPRGITRSERTALLRGLLGDDGDTPLDTLTYRRGLALPLSYEDGAATRWGLREERWRGSNRAHSWVTATPLMLDRFPKRGDAVKAVRESVRFAGYPEPAEVELLPEPAPRGAVRRPRPGTMPRRTRRPLVHCRLRFAQPVRGPVLVGSLRYLGCGLFVPETTDA